MTESASANAAALDATAATGPPDPRSVLERAAADWEFATDEARRSARKVAKLGVQLDDATQYATRAEARRVQAEAVFLAAKNAVEEGAP